MNVKEQAHHYLAKGLSIIPVGKDKRPLVKWEEFQKRQPTTDEVEQWFQKWPDANIAIVTGLLSGMVVVDFDSPEALETAKAKGLPKTPMVKTGKGWHAYFKYQEGVRNFQKHADLPGIDLRGEGGYVVAPPSVHENGSTYSGCSGDSPLANLPEWVLAKNVSEKTPLKELEQGVSEGDRNTSLARLAGSWFDKGLSYDECLKEALKWNQKNNPPLSDKEVEATVKSINKIHQKTTLEEEADIPQIVETSFYILKNGSLAEMLFDRTIGQVGFALYDPIKRSVTYVPSIAEGDKEIIPLQNEKLITAEIPSVWLPSIAQEYGSEAELFNEVKAFVKKYVIMDDSFANLVALYVMFTWVYDCYTVLPYLRVLGDFGTGKSRFLYTVGLICYKPMLVLAAVGEAPIFRIIQRFKGTLVLDEANFKTSDVNTAIIQILNGGFEKKAPVLRCTGANYSVEGFQAFCPKIISSREKWKDSALESRCITWISSVSDKAPLYLNDTFNQEAMTLRNKLLMFRFRNYGPKTIDESKLKCYAEPRIKQILLPLTSLFQDEAILNQINEIAKNMHKELIEDRRTRLEARILQAIKDIEDKRPNKEEKIYLNEIVVEYNKHIPSLEKHITAQTVSNTCRKPELMIEVLPKDSTGRSVICKPERMSFLYNKYGIE